MWELAPKFGARIVFAEHRYEGESLPPASISSDCLSYASTIQALRDYARLLEEKINPGNKAPVVVFGGSYGGMLSAWMRMKYPHLVAGAIAASAPIGAFPQSADSKIDSSARVITRGLDLPYPPTAKQKAHDDEKGKEEPIRERTGRRLQGATGRIGTRTPPRAQGAQQPESSDDKNHCTDNLLAAWPLITWLAKQGGSDSQNLLKTSFSMCDPLPDTDATPLLRWAQSVWFDLAEGSFPYPSSYIPFALLHKKVDLPPWPTQDACWKSSQLHSDWGVRFHGSREDVRYRVDYGDSGISLDVDWNSVNLVENKSKSENAIGDSADIVGLLTSVRDAVSVWYNITKDIPCYDIAEAAPNTRGRMTDRRKRTTRSLFVSPPPAVEAGGHESHEQSRTRTESFDSGTDPAKLCREAMVEQGSWGMLCCNDEMNLVITDATGMGRDFFWPPSHPRNVRTYRDMIQNATFEPCPDPYGIYGYSKEPYEPLSTRLDTYYGGIHMRGHSNIVFSNGLLDPWSAGGVYDDEEDTDPNKHPGIFGEDRAEVRYIAKNDVVALIIPFGGHHTDLMYSSESDPKCVTEGRNAEEAFIGRWINDWNQ